MSTTAEAAAHADAYLSDFNRLERELSRHGRPAVQRLRKAAIARFGELGFPGPRNEDWKFTSAAPLARAHFRPAPRQRAAVTAAQLRPLAFGMAAANRLVFVNGHHAPELSALAPLPAGVVAGSVAEALAKSPDVVEAHLARYARFDDLPFTALNTAFFQDGALLVVPRGTVVGEPIHLVFVATAPGVPAAPAAVSYPRNLLVAGSNSQVTVVEHYLGLADEVYLTNAVTEVVAEDNAVVDHYKVQEEGRSAFHLANTQVHQARTSNFASQLVGLGGALVRNEVRVLLDAEGCECTLNGLYQASGTQHMDNHTVIDHARPHCASHELYKGILDGRAHGVFNGKIYVRQDAQKTDAKQTNQTLLLSEGATINTKPQLEIYADDVKCTHGATVGQLDADALFYLRARGLGAAEARSLLTFAFANDVIGRIKVAPLRERLEQVLLAARHLPRVEETEE